VTQKIRKAVFPVAGLGTRFLPATKANPKEMLPVVDKPLIQYAAEEAVAAGAEVLIFVTGRNKRAIPDHFDRAYELENELALREKEERLRAVQNIVPEGVDCVYIRQAEALGLGHAVHCARNLVGDEPFFVVLADDLVHSRGEPCLSQMARQFQEHQGSILGVQRVSEDQVSRYGIVDSEPVSEHISRLRGMVEKPAPADAPSNLGVIGRYVLTPRIFDLLATTGRGAGGEIQLTDAIDQLLKEEAVFAYDFEGKRYDCGDKLGYLQANVELALAHEELGPEFHAYLREFSKTL